MVNISDTDLFRASIQIDIKWSNALGLGEAGHVAVQTKVKLKWFQVWA